MAFHRGKSGILGVIGFNSGVFSIYELPTFTSIHSLSISSEEITSVAINKSGDWLAFGCPKLGQVLVWEWKSETYVLKQQGHHFDMNCVDFSRDGQIMATGGDDGKIKLWNSDTGYCFVTFNEHAAPITDICFNRSNIVLSSSRDGTVRAFDLTRYRNFRTFTPPMEEPVQLTCVTSDPSGDIVCAGSLDPFNIYVWSLRTAKILEVLSGHEGPISQLAFSAQKNLLVSSSWDKTVRIWDVFSTKAANEVLSHGSDVVCLAISPDGSQVCSATLDGQLYFWDISDGKLLGIIEGKKDIIGGRKKEDPRTALNSTQGNHFTT